MMDICRQGQERLSLILGKELRERLDFPWHHVANGDGATGCVDVGKEALAAIDATDLVVEGQLFDPRLTLGEFIELTNVAKALPDRCRR